MTLRSTISALALAAVATAALSTAALADRGMNGEGKGGPMQILMEKFDEIDADKDGKVTQAELEAHRAARFTAADTNGDGALDAAELDAFVLAEMQARAADRSARMLERMDANADGKLGADELPGGQGDGRGFAMVDADGDGAITKVEAEAAMTKMAEHRGGHGKGHGKGHGWGFWGNDG